MDMKSYPHFVRGEGGGGLKRMTGDYVKAHTHTKIYTGWVLESALFHNRRPTALIKHGCFCQVISLDPRKRPIGDAR